MQQQKAAKAAGLRWGAYHFADASNTDGQAANFLRFACPDQDEMFVLDWEDNPSGNGRMSKGRAFATKSPANAGLFQFLQNTATYSRQTNQKQMTRAGKTSDNSRRCVTYASSQIAVRSSRYRMDSQMKPRSGSFHYAEVSKSMPLSSRHGLLAADLLIST